MCSLILCHLYDSDASVSKLNDVCVETDLICKSCFAVMSVAPPHSAYVSDKFIDFALMHSYGMEVQCGLTARCSMTFTQVHQLTDRRRDGWGSELFNALDSPRRRGLGGGSGWVGGRGGGVCCVVVCV